MNSRHSSKILLVSAEDGIRSALERLITSDAALSFTVTQTVSGAKEHMKSEIFDLIMINAPLTDENGILFAADCAGSISPSSSVAVIVRENIYEKVKEEMEGLGVFVIAKPTTITVLKEALSWMATVRQRMKKMEAQNIEIQRKLKETNIINRAKCLLISSKFMTEQDAHKYIEKTAMDHCIPRVEVAQHIISEHSC